MQRRAACFYFDTKLSPQLSCSTPHPVHSHSCSSYFINYFFRHPVPTHWSCSRLYKNTFSLFLSFIVNRIDSTHGHFVLNWDDDYCFNHQEASKGGVEAAIFSILPSQTHPEFHFFQQLEVKNPMLADKTFHNFRAWDQWIEVIVSNLVT